MLSGVIDFFNEFKQNKAGLVGLFILLACILIIIFESFIIPYKEASSRWRDINYWQDNAVSAPPVWVNFFKSEKAQVTEKIMPISVVTNDNQIITKFYYNYEADLSPLNIIYHSISSGDVSLEINVLRPDKKEINLVDNFYANLDNSDLRVSLFNDAKNRIFRFYRENVSRLFRNRIDINTNPISILFNVSDDEMATKFTPLKGEYIFTVTSSFTDNSKLKNIENPYFVIVGSVSGLMGTDNMKRDIFSGLIVGLKWALFIGMITSFFAVIFGVMYGIISAYFGGKVDAIMQFIFQIFVGIPTLPIMIVLAAVFKPSIWVIISLMIFFSWTGAVMTVRSMAMQMKEEVYIEASRALGASHTRIILTHLAPLLLPFSFSSMALAVPAFIIYESSLSLLGLGDATIVTWGQILHDAMKGSALLSGLWWWIIPPGIFIAILGMSFAFVGFALDKILHPKLKVR